MTQELSAELAEAHKALVGAYTVNSKLAELEQLTFMGALNRMIDDGAWIADFDVCPFESWINTFLPNYFDTSYVEVHTWKDNGDAFAPRAKQVRLVLETDSTTITMDLPEPLRAIAIAHDDHKLPYEIEKYGENFTDYGFLWEDAHGDGIKDVYGQPAPKSADRKIA